MNPNYKTLSDVSHNYMVVNSKETEQLLLSSLQTCTDFTFDTETGSTETGSALIIHSLQLVGISFAFSVNEAYYLPVPEDPAQADILLLPYKPFFENHAISKTGHNLKFDINVLRRYNITVHGQIFDTMIAHYLIDSDAKHGLKILSKEMLNYQQIEIEELIGKGKNQLSMRDIPIEEAAVYAAEDVDQTIQLRNKLQPLLKEKGVEGLFTDIEMPLVKVLADMEYTGINVDYDTLLNLDIEADAELESLQQQIFEKVGAEFNINSNQDLREVLFEELGLESTAKTKTGEYSTNKKTLAKLNQANPVVPLILKYKAVAAIKNSFLSKLPNNIHPDTGRIHSNFRQARVVTGRLSSSKPNLQNIPRESEGFGTQIRKIFIPRDENHAIVSADYSQIELRVIAHYSKDPVMTEAFKNDEDIHTATASKIFGVPVAEIGKNDERRKAAKAINFGLNYLMSVKTLAERISAETKKEVDVEKAKEYIESYFEAFSGVRDYHEESYYLATVNGYSTTLFGRRRYLKEIDSPFYGKRMAAKRLAANTPIQGTAADIIKKAMVELHRELLQNNFKTKIVLQVHDELVFDVPKDELDRVIPLIKKIMEGAVQLDVPLKVDIGVGENWLEAH
jgi:DNA polymerase I